MTNYFVKHNGKSINLNEFYIQSLKEKLEYLLSKKIETQEGYYLVGLIDATRSAIDMYETIFGKEANND